LAQALTDCIAVGITIEPTAMAMTRGFQVLVVLAMSPGVAADDDGRDLLVAYNTTLEPSPCATAGPVPTPAPASPCATAAPVITTTTTPASPCGTVAPVITNPTPASPCGTVAPATTVTTTPSATTVAFVPVATYTTTPAATGTTTPAATFTTTPAATITTTPAGTVAPAAKFAVNQAGAEKKGNSLIQRMADTPITSGLFGLLLASAVIGMIVRASRSYRSTRLTFTGRRISTNDESDYNDILASDVEQAFIE